MPKADVRNSLPGQRALCAAALACIASVSTTVTASELRVSVSGLNPAEAKTTTRQHRLDAGLAPNDPLYPLQWNLHLAPSASNDPDPIPELGPKHPARIVVAVVDSGFLLMHEDLQFLPGYDFVSNAAVANDGDGRDTDPTDPGDWVDPNTPGCTTRDSSWHGTRVAGVIGASTSNHTGIAAANSQVDLLPVRVTGSCGGFVQDLIDGLRWSAGLPIDGVPDNPHPAQVINLSLGFAGQCPVDLQRAIDEVTLAGAVVVSASTNTAVDLDETPHSPASCNRVLTVGASTRSGRRATYSAYGAAVDLLAPGGDRADGILTTDNAGETTAANGDTYNSHYGTSLAGAHVSAVVAALKAESPELNAWQIRNLLYHSASPLDQAAGCGFLSCGGGLLNAAAALQMLQTGIANDLSVEPQIPLGAANAPTVDPGAGSTVWISLAPLAWIVFRRRRSATQ